jgi:capsular polysaccharide biosynthesis protein
MSVAELVQVLWRHKVWSAVVIGLTLVGGMAVMIGVSPVYEASASYLVIRPPDPPTQAQLQANPDLAKVESDNPYVRLGDPNIIINVVSREAGSSDTRAALMIEGVTGDYTVSPSNKFGFASPIIDVSAQSDTARGAIDAVGIIGDEVLKELKAVQQVDQVDDRYMFHARLVESGDAATARSSGRIRALMAVLAIGALCSLMLVMTLHARDRRRDRASFSLDVGVPDRLGYSPARHRSGQQIDRDSRPSIVDGNPPRLGPMQVESADSRAGTTQETVGDATAGL